VDRNLVFAFVLMIGAFIFFNSDLYNKTIMGKKDDPLHVEESAPNTESRETGPSSDAQLLKTIEEKKAEIIDQTIGIVVPDSASRTITVIGDKFIGTINTRGAVVSSWQLSEYVDSSGNNVDLIPRHSGNMLNLTIDRTNFDGAEFSTEAADTVILRGNQTLVFTYVSPEGVVVEKGFMFSRDAYDFRFYFTLKGTRANEYTLGWKSGITETEKDYDGQYADDPIGIFYGDDVDHPVGKKDTLKEIEGSTKWVSLKSKYFSGTLQPDESGELRMRFVKLGTTPYSNNSLNFSVDISDRIDQDTVAYRVYLIPNKYGVLKGYGIKLDKTLFKGYSWFFKADIWFPPLCGLVLYVLNFFYGLIPNYGVAIIFLTILSKIITYPLSLKSMKSMARMKKLQPKMAQIREKYKNDPMNMNKAVMNMYKEEGVSPLGGAGCVPIVLQMPIFIALFVTLRKAIELRGAPFILWIKDLSGPEAIYMLPSKILFYGPNVSVLTVLMAISTYFQSKQTMTDPKQKSMVYIMPVVMLFFFNSMPSGLILYWTLSNILGIAQNAFFKPNLDNEPPLKKKKPFRAMSYNELLKKRAGK